MVAVVSVEQRANSDFIVGGAGGVVECAAAQQSHVNMSHRKKKNNGDLNQKGDARDRQQEEAKKKRENSERIKKRNEDVRKKRERDQKKAERKLCFFCTEF